MSEFAVSHRQQQEQVNAYFQSQSSFWQDIYSRGGVQAEIYRTRQARALSWIDSLGLAPGSRVLEIGCGAGFMAVALAQRGFRVHAIDSAEAMIELARRHATEAGVSDWLSLDIGDVYALAFEDETFDLVTALGVIPWLARPELALQEMARVSRSGGYVILTANNPQGLWTLLDPWKNPVVKTLKRRVKTVLERTGLRRPRPAGTPRVAWTFHKRGFIDEALANTDLIKTRGVTLGFGPFSFRHREILPDALAIAFHQRLQRLADRGVPLLRSSGSHYLVLGRRGESAVSHRQQQEQVNAYFQSQSSFWQDVYAHGSVQAEIYRTRQARALSWIDSLGLAPGSRVLEIGCGAGFMAVALAQRGFRVHAIDSAEAMIELARRHATEAGVSDWLSLDIGDVYALAFEDETFDLVVAIGVIAWLARPELALQEMARVSRSGGYVILTAPNPAELHSLLDPWKNPVVKTLKRRVKTVLERTGLRRPKPGGAPRATVIFHKRGFIDEVLANTDLIKTRGVTLGFGPFSFRHRKILPDALAIAFHQRLQRLADRGVPLLRSTGMSYLILTRKWRVHR